MKKSLLSASFVFALITPACAVQTADDAPASNNEAFTVCIGAPAAVASQPLAPANFETINGIDATSAATYGGVCTKEFVVETTGTTGAYLPMSATAILQPATVTSSLGCVGSQLVIDAWGGNFVPQPDGYRLEWTHIQSKNVPSKWDGVNRYCSLGGSLDTLNVSPYSRVRVGARATTGTTSIPVEVKMGYIIPGPG